MRAILAGALPISLWLGSVSLLLTFVIGVAVGSLQAARRDRWIDRLLTGLTTAVYAAPSYWLSLTAGEREAFAARAARYMHERLSMAAAIERRIRLWAERMPA